MKKLIINIFIVFILMILGIIMKGHIVEAAKINTIIQEIPSPTVIEIGKNNFSSRPLIKGLTIQNTDILIYIDDDFLGKAFVNRENTGVDNFYYKPQKNLTNGKHKLTIIAIDFKNNLLKSKKDIEFEINELPAPTLIKPNKQDKISKVKPLIKGLTKNTTFVHFYIDGVYNGKTEVLEHISGVANFAYKPFLNLDIGEHIVWAIAEDENGKKSKISKVLKFNIEEAVPSPIVFEVDYEGDEYNNQPLIKGLVKDSHFVKVFIDNELNGKTKIIKHFSGTGAFFYRPYIALKKGRHHFFVVAVDKNGKESNWSKIIGFEIKKISELNINNNIKVNTSTIDKINYKDKKSDKLIKLPTINIEEDVNSDLEIDKDIANFLKNEQDVFEKKEIIASNTTSFFKNDKQEKSTTTTESNDKFKINLLIFLLFLIAIIVWIFWVNREIIKEKKMEQAQKNKE